MATKALRCLQRRCAEKETCLLAFQYVDQIGVLQPLFFSMHEHPVLFVSLSAQCFFFHRAHSALALPTQTKGSAIKNVVLAASATGFDAGEVACFLSKDNQDACILHIFSLKEKLPKHCVWEEMQSQEGVPLSAILAPVFHCKSKRGVTTLTPWQWQ